MDGTFSSSDVGSSRAAFSGSISRPARKSCGRPLRRATRPAILTIGAPRMTLDGKTYVYGYNRILSDLFLAEGIK